MGPHAPRLKDGEDESENDRTVSEKQQTGNWYTYSQ